MDFKNQYRDKTIDKMSEADVGSTVRLAGWVENIRDHGGVSFIDLRDQYGVMQIVLRDTTLLDGIVKEMSISVEGLIEHRDEETYNPKIPTGTIELEAHSIDVLQLDGFYFLTDGGLLGEVFLLFLLEALEVLGVALVDGGGGCLEAVPQIFSHFSGHGAKSWPQGFS